MPTRTFPEQIVDLGILNDNLKTHLADLPHLAPLQTELEALIAEAQRLEAEQEVHKKRLLVTNEQRNKLEARGKELKSQLDAALRGHFGPKSKELVEFGFRPRGGRHRKTADQQEPPPTPKPA